MTMVFRQQQQQRNRAASTTVPFTASVIRLVVNPVMIVSTICMLLVVPCFPNYNTAHGFIFQSSFLSSSSVPRISTTGVSTKHHHHQQTVLFSNNNGSRPDDTMTTPATVIPTSSSFRDEAESLQAKARQLRKEIMIDQETRNQQSPSIATSITNTNNNNNNVNSVVLSPFTIVSNDKQINQSGSEQQQPDYDDDNFGEYYRLYVDIGREDGTWMDARWGASGKRIPLSLDVKLFTNKLADPTVSALMVNDNGMGTTSPVYTVQTAKFARLKGGFDKMACYGGAYRVDGGGNGGGQYTLRMVIQVEGTKADQNYMYGDLSIPKGGLYFSLPCFGGKISQLSMKEGPVTVRQSGWHTGWRRKESRIVGVFNAKPLAVAQQRDSY